MQKIIFILKVILIVSFTCSCGFNRGYSGEVKEIHGDTVCIPSKCFKLFPNAPKTKIGNRAVFIPVKKTDKRINCTLIN